MSYREVISGRFEKAVQKESRVALTRKLKQYLRLGRLRESNERNCWCTDAMEESVNETRMDVTDIRHQANVKHVA